MVNFDNLRKPNVFLKCVEIFLFIIAISTFFSGVRGWGIYVATVLIGAFINTLVIFVCYIADYTQLEQTPLELLLYFYYIIALFASAICLFVSGWASFIVSGVFCLVLAVVFGLDMYLAFVNIVQNRPSTYPTEPNPTTITNPTLQPMPSAGTVPPPDTTDGGRAAPYPSSIYNTNPTYPETLNYPPATMNVPPPEYPANNPIGNPFGPEP